MYIGTLYKSLKDYWEDQCDEDGAPQSDLIACYPPSIYFGRTPAYELHVYRPKTDYQANIVHLRQLRANVYSALHAVLVALTPQQAAGCLRNDMFIILLDGTTSAPSCVHRGEFYQQRAPAANPLFTLKEAGFMRLACGIFRFYGDTDFADLINQTLQLALPEEDYISQLLYNCHLEDLDSFIGHCTSRKHVLYDSARRLQIKQDQFYWQHGDADTVPPPHVPTGLLQLTTLTL